MDIIYYIGVSSLVYICVKIAKAIRNLSLIYSAKSMVDFSQINTAIVTGATDGIGKAIAFELARRGVKRLVLIGRNPAKLDDVSAEIKAIHGKLLVRVVVTDFCRTDIYERINVELQDIHDIDLLINNVGATTDVLKRFHEISQENVLGMINVNGVSTVLMSHLVIRKMMTEQQKQPIIVNVSSILDSLTPSVILYSSLKTFVSRFSYALRLQYPNMVVLNAAPGSVTTKMTAYDTRPGCISPESCANNILDQIGVLEDTNVAIVHTLSRILLSIMPDKVVIREIRKTLDRVEKYQQ